MCELVAKCDPTRCPLCPGAKHPEQFACKTCWSKLPDHLRARVFRAYRDLGGRHFAAERAAALAAVVREYRSSHAAPEGRPC